jgi:hypothetical protein
VLRVLAPGTILQGDLGEIVSLESPTSPCDELREKFNGHNKKESLFRKNHFSLKSLELLPVPDSYRDGPWTYI